MDLRAVVLEVVVVTRKEAFSSNVLVLNTKIFTHPHTHNNISIQMWYVIAIHVYEILSMFSPYWFSDRKVMRPGKSIFHNLQCSLLEDMVQTGVKLGQLNENQVLWSFGTLTLLVGQQDKHPECKKTWVARSWHRYLSGARCRLAYDPAMPPPLSVSCFGKIQIGFTFLILDHLGRPGHRPLKGCCCCWAHSMGP